MIYKIKGYLLLVCTLLHILSAIGLYNAIHHNGAYILDVMAYISILMIIINIQYDIEVLMKIANTRNVIGLYFIACVLVVSYMIHILIIITI